LVQVNLAATLNIGWTPTALWLLKSSKFKKPSRIYMSFGTGRNKLVRCNKPRRRKYVGHWHDWHSSRSRPPALFRRWRWGQTNKPTDTQTEGRRHRGKPPLCGV